MEASSPSGILAVRDYLVQIVMEPLFFADVVCETDAEILFADELPEGVIILVSLISDVLPVSSGGIDLITPLGLYAFEESAPGL